MARSIANWVLPRSCILAFVTLLSCVPVNAQVRSGEQSREARIEYIAHASFRFVDHDGSSVVVDPYNSRIWLGYDYPTGIEADAVLITHPHFDHDASYYFSNDTPVHRDPGDFQVGRIKVRGIATEHAEAESIRKRGGDASNTIWVLEIGGKKILHLGDTRELTDAELLSIGPVNVILTNPEKFDRIDRMKTALKADTIILMHYRLLSASGPGGGQGMETIDEWIGKRQNVLRLLGSSHSMKNLEPGIVVIPPASHISWWSKDRLEASAKMKQASIAFREKPANLNRVERLLQQALKLDAGNISIYSFLARLQFSKQETKAGADILEQGLINATHLDHSTSHRIHTQLVGAYKKLGDIDKVRSHQQWIVQQPRAYGAEAYDTALKNLEETNNP